VIVVQAVLCLLAVVLLVLSGARRDVSLAAYAGAAVVLAWAWPILAAVL